MEPRVVLEPIRMVIKYYLHKIISNHRQRGEEEEGEEGRTHQVERLTEAADQWKGNVVKIIRSVEGH